MRAGSARPGSSMRRPDTGASLDYLAAPAAVRAGSAAGPPACTLNMHIDISWPDQVYAAAGVLERHCRITALTLCV